MIIFKNCFLSFQKYILLYIPDDAQNSLSKIEENFQTKSFKDQETKLNF